MAASAPLPPNASELGDGRFGLFKMQQGVNFRHRVEPPVCEGIVLVRPKPASVYNNKSLSLTYNPDVVYEPNDKLALQLAVTYMRDKLNQWTAFQQMWSLLRQQPPRGFALWRHQACSDGAGGSFVLEQATQQQAHQNHHYPQLLTSKSC
jgi:hypothetical protein